MTIDSLLLGLQTLLLGLYGLTGIARLLSKNKYWGFITLAVAGLVALLTFLFTAFISTNLQFLFLVLLLLNAIPAFSNTKWKEALVFSTLLSLSCLTVYFQWDQGLAVLIAVLLLVILLFLLISQCAPWFVSQQHFFLKVGTLLTLLFAAEPVYIQVLQNLKPIATIPVQAIVNPQNLSVIGVLLLLALGGFIWKEKFKT